MLEVGEQLTSPLGITYDILRLLGSGGQGEVYEVTAGNKHYALKWYFPHMATNRQAEIIQKLVHTGKPDERFLWPMDFVMKGDTFGYIMELRPHEYKSIVDLMKRKAEPSFKALCLAGYELADCFQKLHSLGYSYCDISFGNAFFNPDNGQVLVCDNDNVVINKEAKECVQGTLGFMAPEIVMGKGTPNAQTDLFSLAVLLFYMFMLHHPLEGAAEASIKCLDMRAKQRLYGEKPVFIWDKDDLSNRPVAGYQDNAIIYWRLYPRMIRDLFMSAFTEGLYHPNKRILENQWKRAFFELQDHIMLCPNCGAENFYENQEAIGAGNICWSCNQNVSPGALLVLGDKVIVLHKDTIIYPHHFYQDFDLSKEVAKVTQHPKEPQKWGLQNKTLATWQVKKQDGQIISIPPEKSMSLQDGLEIDFGQFPSKGVLKKHS